MENGRLHSLHDFGDDGNFENITLHPDEPVRIKKT